MMTALTSAAAPFVALVALTFSDGSAITAEGEAFSSYDACMVQVEHDARIMFNEAIQTEMRRENNGRHLEGLEYDCLPMRANYHPHKGWMPVEE